jgi:hypothetical protein
MSNQSLEALEAARTRSLSIKIKRSLQRRGLGGTLNLMAWKIGHPLGNWLLPSRWRARRLDYGFDAKFGVDTRGIIELDKLTIDSRNIDHGVHYEQTKPTDFATLINHLALKFEDFIFVDFGSGKGRVLLMASDYPFRKIIGIEFAQELFKAAQQNLRTYRSERQQCRTFELHCLDAVEYQVLPENTVFYFYNPFDEVVMKVVLTKIYQSLLEHPREAFILYCNSRCRDLLPQFGFVEIESSHWYAIYRFEKRTKGEIKVR